jgi:hypothetical protein
MKGALSSSEASVLIGATQRNIPEDGILRKLDFNYAHIQGHLSNAISNLLQLTKIASLLYEHSKYGPK